MSSYDNFSIDDDISASYIGYADDPKTYAMQVLLALVRKYVDTGAAKSELLSQQLSRTVRELFDESDIDPNLLLQGTLSHNQVSNLIKDQMYSDRGNVGLKIMENVLRLDNNPTAANKVRYGDNKTILQNHIRGEREVSQALGESSKFKPDTLVFYEQNGVLKMYIVDYKLGGGVDVDNRPTHNYAAQIDAYAEIWNQLSVEDRRALLPTQYKKWQTNQN